MKKIAKCIAFVSVLLFGAVASVGCGPKSGGDEHTIQIYMWKSGFGVDWMEKTVQEFNAMQDEYTAVLETNSAAATIISSLSLGKGNEYDLYFTMLNTAQYNKNFAPLDDVLKSKATGEDVTIESKYDKGLLDGMKNADGTVNALNYASGWTGILYNKTKISEDRLPNTTKELELLVSELNGDGVKPWLFYNDQYNNGYWNYVTSVWEAQYDGLDYYYNTMMKLEDEEGNTPSKEVMLGTDKGISDSYQARLKDGRYQAFKVMESVITPETVHAECTNTNFTTVQNLFLSGEAAMSINGNWIMKEMGKVNENIGIMKIPVISSITEKLEDSAMSDATLSAIIDQIDEGATSSDLCSSGDFAKIKEARSLMYNNGTELYVFVPNYSNGIDGAKEFLRYFYSDAGMLNYMNSTHLPGPVHLTEESKFDQSVLSDWNKASFELSETMTPLVTKMDRSELFKNLGINQFANLVTAQALSARNPKDRKNADQLWQSFVAKVNENWGEWAV